MNWGEAASATEDLRATVANTSLSKLAQHGNPVFCDIDSTRVANQARKRLGIPHAKMAVTSTLAAALMGWRPPENRTQQLEVLRAFLGRYPTKTAAADAIETARLASGYERPPSRREKRIARQKARQAFYSSRSWLTLRVIVLKKRGNRCECCGASPPDVRIHVDHIKPRALFPTLALDETNLQVLCDACNRGKGAWDETDWRKQ